MDEVIKLMENLDNGIPGTPEQTMKRVKLPIPQEYGGGWATGSTLEDAVRNLLEKVGKRTATDTPTFGECAERWLSIKMGEDRSPSTIANYERMLKDYILPKFKSAKIDKIKPDDIQIFFNGIMNLSKSTSNQCKAVLSGIFEMAERNEIIQNNPMRFKYEHSNKVGKKVVLQDADLVSVIDSLEKLEGLDYMYASFLCFSALRRSEILGLKWEDLDFQKREIHVRRAISFPDGKNSPVENLPKDGSVGVVHLNSELARRLEEYRQKTGTYVFPYSKTRNKEPITRSMFNKMWARINKAIDLKGATSHSFRASYATMMNAHCTHIDPKALQGALRHRTPDLALKVYTKENVDKTRIAEVEYDAWLSRRIAT